jgi:putative NADH-flavin reductase
MQIAVFGGSGKTGQALIDQALARGDTVTALARDPAKIALKPGLTVIKGDAQDWAAVAKTIAGADVVMSTLGNFNRKPNTEVSDCTKTIADAMKAGGGSKRLVVVTTIGAGDSWAQMSSFVFKYIIIKWLAKNIWADRDRQEAVIKASGLDWTIIRPGGLRDEPGTGVYQAPLSGGGPLPKKIAIPRADVAHFMLKAAGDPATIGKAYNLFA